MKKIFFFILMTSILMLFSFYASSLEKKEKDIIFRLSFLTPGIGIELRIKDNFTILGQTGVGIYAKEEDNKTHLQFPFYVYISPRYYYDLEKRRKQSKRVYNFSANYVGIILSNLFESSYIDQRFFITGVWGLKRSFSKNWYYEFSIGLEVYFQEDKNGLMGHMVFGLGIIF